MHFIDIEKVDLRNGFFHYAPLSSVDNISEKGLLPLIGVNSKGLEMTEKVFFVRGAGGILEIWDVWIKWRYYVLQMNKAFLSQQV